MADEYSSTPPSSDSPPPRTTGGNWRWEPPSAEELQALMPGYTIEKILGRGGMGAVYRGVQTNLDRPVAIKILPPGVEKEDPSFAERFKSEAKLMAKLNHPAVVAVYDFGTTSAGQLYFAMEYVDGSDVHQMIAAQGKLPPEHALAITAHVCDALAAAHELGIVHRDIKPANVLLNMKGQVKVADFGLAKVEEPGQHGLTKTGYAMGTPDFVAPEALTLGTAIDGRADLYAVGVMLYQMLTGNIPRGAFKPASVLVPGLDPRYDPIIVKAMQHDREERHQSAMELRRELDVIMTVPLVQHNAPASAAIPVAQMAQAPGQRSAVPKPVGNVPPQRTEGSAGTPARSSSPGGAAAKKPEADRSVRAPLPPAKSKAPLFLGLGAAAAIGIGAFVMFGGKKAAKQSGPLNRSAAEIASQGLPEGQAERGNPLSGTSVATAPKPAQGTERTTLSPPTPPKPAPPVSKSPSPPVSKSSTPAAKSSEPQFPPGKWVKLFTKFEDLPDSLRQQGVKMENGWIRFGGTKRFINLPSHLTGNYGVRLTYLRQAQSNDATTGPASISVRLQRNELNGYNANVRDLTFICNLRESGKDTKILGKDCLDAPRIGVEATLELSVIGKQLIGRVGDRLTASVTNDRWKGGTAKISGSEDIRDIEIINLDGISEAEALKILGVDEKGNDLRQKPAAVASAKTAPSASPISNLKSPISNAAPAAFPPGQWVKLFTKFEDLPEDLRKPDSGVKFEDGWIRLGQKKWRIALPAELHSNCAVRARFMRHGMDTENDRIILHRASGSAEYYLLSFKGTKFSLQQCNATVFTSLTEINTPPLSSGNEYTMEFGAINDRLIGRYGDSVLKVADGSQLKHGESYIFGSEDIRDIEVINLDGLSEAEALRILGVDEKGNDLRALAAKQEQQMAEMAKQADAMAAIPELKALHEQFVKLTAERVTAPFEAEMAKLNAGYVGGIDREIAQEKKAGHLDGVLALEEEKKLIQGVTASSRQTSDSRRLEAVAPCPIPAEDDEKTPEALKKLRGIYRDAYAKLDAARAANLKTLTDPLSIRLKQLEAELTQKDRVPDAKTVREYRENLGKEGSAGTPARNATNGGAAATMNEADKSVRAPLKKFPPGDDRKAAEWVLSVGGRVQIYTGGRVISVSDAAKLPRGKFSVLVVYLEFPDGAPKVPFTDMLPLAGLRELKELRMLKAPVGDEALEIIPSLPSLLSFRADTMNLTDAVFAHFALSKLTAFHLLNCMKVTGEKVAVLANGKSLEQLTLQSCRLSDAGVQEIGKLASLTTLNLSGTGLNDDHLKALRELKNLSTLLLKRNGLSAQALAGMTTVWHDVQELEFDFRGGEVVSGSEVLARAFPKIESFGFSRPGATPYSAADLAGLKAFPKLTTIILWNIDALAADAGEGVLTLDKLDRIRFDQCPAVTDKMMESLSNHKSLSSLRWAGLQITDISLTHIAKLRSLTKLEISDCPNLTDAAIAAFQKERPEVTVTK